MVKSLHKEWVWGIWRLIFDRYDDGTEYLVLHNTMSNIAITLNRIRDNSLMLYDGENDKECEIPMSYVKDMISEWS
jgi:hypothetical protein